jgi:LPS export ABC transporter protein LptC
VRHVATKDGRTEWAVEAESALCHREGNKTLFKDVAATFFLEGGKEVHLTGKEGLLLSDTKDMEISGTVVLKSGLYELNTEKLKYRHGSKSISTDSPVKIQGKLMRLTGNSMEFDLVTERLIVMGRVQAVMEGLHL